MIGEVRRGVARQGQAGLAYSGKVGRVLVW